MRLCVDVDFRDLQQGDLPMLGWSGGSAHLQAMTDFLHRAWLGEVEAVVAELPTGLLVAHGVVDFVRQPGSAHLTTLCTREEWQGLGLGTAMIAELEGRGRDRGLRRAQLTVELDNPRAAALYRRLGYRGTARVVEHWPLDSGELFHAECELMVKPLAG